jgi:hypothetical protein
MKRLALIVGIVLCAALGIGAFVIAGSDNHSEAKSPSTTAKNNEAKDAANEIVSALPPVPGKHESDDKNDDGKKDDNEELDGYEAKKAFVGVSPSKVKAGKELEIEVRGFAPKIEVTVNISTSPLTTIKLTTDKKGRAKWKGAAPTVIDTYAVIASGGTRSASTTLTVVAKK